MGEKLGICTLRLFRQSSTSKFQLLRETTHHGEATNGKWVSIHAGSGTGDQTSRHEVPCNLKTEKFLGRCSGSAINRLRVHPGPMGTRNDALCQQHHSAEVALRGTPQSSRFTPLCTLKRGKSAPLFSHSNLASSGFFAPPCLT